MKRLGLFMTVIMILCITVNAQKPVSYTHLESVNADANDGKLSAHLNYNYRTSDGWQLNPYEESKGELVEKMCIRDRKHSL